MTARCGQGGALEDAADAARASRSCSAAGADRLRHGGVELPPPPAPSVTRYTSPGEKAAPGPADGLPTQSVALGETVTADWWTLFRSPDLDQLVKQAIAGSPTPDERKGAD